MLNRTYGNIRAKNDFDRGFVMMKNNIKLGLRNCRAIPFHPPLVNRFTYIVYHFFQKSKVFLKIDSSER